MALSPMIESNHFSGRHCQRSGLLPLCRFDAGREGLVDSGEISHNDVSVGSGCRSGPDALCEALDQNWRSLAASRLDVHGIVGRSHVHVPVGRRGGIDASRPFRWTPPVNADAQILRVGTSPGANDLFDSGQIHGTSANVNGLPYTGTLYARALSRVGGVWRSTDIGLPWRPTPVSSIVVPRNGQTLFDTVQRIRLVVSAAGAGLSPDNRFHVRGEQSARQRRDSS